MLKSLCVLFVCCVGLSVAQAFTEDNIELPGVKNAYPDYWGTPRDCGPNEENKCVGCPPEDSCYDRNQILCPDAFMPCRPRCVCKDGFIRKTLGTECIPKNECGAPCGVLEEYSECKQCRNETCSSIVNPVNCSSEETCTPGCVCWEGYYREDQNSTCSYRCFCNEAGPECTS